MRTHPWLAGEAPRGGLSTRVGFPATVDGDDPERERAALRRALADTLGPRAVKLAWAKQVHGAEVVQVRDAGQQGEADALVARSPGPVLLVSVADCCPVLAWDSVSGVYGVAHAGWRGLAKGVLQRFARELAQRGADLARVRAWIGPSIGPCCFEVGPEVAGEFEAASVVLPVATTSTKARPHVDLRAASALRLAREGIAPERIAVCPDCTACRGELYFSFRRDRGICGRHLGYLTL